MLAVTGLLVVAVGISGAAGVVLVLSMAAVTCVSTAVAGDALQEFQVGYILGASPKALQIAQIISAVVTSLVMYFPLMVLQTSNINKGGIGFGDRELSAPQAGVISSLAQGIVSGDLPWPLIMAGIILGITMIIFRVKSPMLVATGMYLPLAATAAIFVGGILRWITMSIQRRRGYGEAQNARVDNVGVIVASGLIAGEALAGIIVAALYLRGSSVWSAFAEPSYGFGLVVLAIVALALVKIPLSNAGQADDRTRIR